MSKTMILSAAAMAIACTSCCSIKRVSVTLGQTKDHHRRVSVAINEPKRAFEDQDECHLKIGRPSITIRFSGHRGD